MSGWDALALLLVVLVLWCVFVALVLVALIGQAPPYGPPMPTL